MRWNVRRLNLLDLLDLNDVTPRSLLEHLAMNL